MNEGNRTSYEVQDASIREVIVMGAGIAIGTAIVCLLMWGVFNGLKSYEASRQPLNPMAPPSQLPPEPRLQVQPWVDLESHRRHEDMMLGSYGWADKNAGKVRLPIDRAVDLVLERGLPVKGGAADAAAKR